MTARPAVATSLERELEEQGRWRLRPRCAGVKTFDRLLRNEFLTPDRQAAGQAVALARVVGFAASQVPYYQDLFAARGLKPDDVGTPADLAKLPLLTKDILRRERARLRAQHLPRGERIFGTFSTTGTTGHPARVVHSDASNAMFTYLTQRQYRWCRFDPGKTIAFLRFPGDLPPRRGGGTYPDGATCRLPRWRYSGTFFETGPWLGLTITTPVERQIEWLRANHPAYLCTHASWLEHLCYAAAGENLADSLESVLVISEDLRPPTRDFVERALGIPVHQNYGTNEIGLMAMRCAAGRYHVHAEHCLIEIVDADGRPCLPGETGRIAVTALCNPAMPLIRYDTDDMAEAVDGPCPCGRSLPSFVELTGRYRRYVFLPEGSYQLFLALRTAVNHLPGDAVRNLRQFQVHQYRDGRFELRVVAAGPLPRAFHEGVRAAWEATIGTRRETLAVIEVDEIPRTAGGKFQDFTSDYMPAPEESLEPDRPRPAVKTGPDIATDLARERAEQARWRLRPRHAGMKIFDRLVRNEFLTPGEQAAAQARALARLVRFAVGQVPYYRDLFAARGLKPDDVGAPVDLAKLPLLTKETLRRERARLQAHRLPRGERIFGTATTTGTTGQPARVKHTVSSNTMFSYLAQRGYRWFRLDPAKTFAFIRSAYDLPRRPDGSLYPDGVPCSLPRWRYAGTFFETGPWLAMTMATPVERQIAWLRDTRPAYLAAHTSWLEHLTYAAGSRTPADSIEGAVALVEQMTPSIEQRIERVFAAPVHQGYGLNEIGLVAARCAAGRYHVHTEHCLVEIVNEDGQLCAPGVAGRIAVTGLRNLAMPLIRYDTDDLAEAAAGPCPCGRTLPGFQNLIGRYRRHVALPEGSYALFIALRQGVDHMPDDLIANLRQFQVHQYRDGRFELRLATTGPLPAEFHERIRAAWDRAAAGRPESLAVVEGADIQRGPGGKFQDFTSDYMPALEQTRDD